MEKILYQSGHTTAEGLLVTVDKTQKRPAILFAHAWMGRDPFITEKLQFAKELGYVGFALDNYGDGIVAKDAQEASELMLPLFINRKELRRRVKDGFDAVSKLPFVDKEKICIVGFCFGGLAALELLYSGAPIKGAISFHGLYESSIEGYQAHLEPIAENISGKALFLHGYNDPLNTEQGVKEIQKTLSEHKINWRFVTFGNTYHAFTNEKANDEKKGLLYNKESSNFAFQIAKDFIQEIFS